MKGGIQPAGRHRMVLLCYGAALLLFLICSVGGFALDASRARRGQLEPKTLTMEDFVLESFVPRNEEGLYVSTDADPHLVYEPDTPFYATGFVFSGRPRNKAGGEMVLYYKTGSQQDYLETNKIWATERPDGSWYFDLGHRRYTGLRFDPDVEGGVLWKVEKLGLEGLKPGLAYFRLSGVALFGLLAGPAFVAAFLQEGKVLYRFIAIRLRAKKKEKA